MPLGERQVLQPPPVDGEGDTFRLKMSIDKYDASFVRVFLGVAAVS